MGVSFLPWVYILLTFFFRPIIPLFDYVRNANSQVTFLRPDQAPEPENQEAEDNSHLVQFRSLPYTQAHLNRIPVAK